MAGKTNRAWHEANRMPRNPTVEQRIQWHLVHREHCQCRPMPAKLALEIETRERTKGSDA